MDIIALKANVVKIKKYRRLVTELNQVIPRLNQHKDLQPEIAKLKTGINSIKKLIVKMEEAVEFNCVDCKSSVKNGKCDGCKRNYLK